MPGRNEAVYKRALMRHLMRRVARLRAQCGVDEEMGSMNGATGSDEFATLSHQISTHVEAIKQDARAKMRLVNSASAQEAVALSHEIRCKRVTLGDEMTRLEGLLRDKETEIERKRERAKGKAKRLGEVSELEALQAQRRTAQEQSQDMVADLDRLIDKVLNTMSAEDERRMQTAGRPSGHAKLNLMGNPLSGGPMARPSAGAPPAMDAETQELFRVVESKNAQIMTAVDGLSHHVKNLKMQAQNMGDQLQTQNIMLDTVEHRIDHLEGDLSTLTVRIGKLSKDVSSSNVVIGLCCCLVLLALVGYILSMVIPGMIPQ